MGDIWIFYIYQHCCKKKGIDVDLIESVEKKNRKLRS